MPIIRDEEYDTDRVVLNMLLTIEEAVIVLLGKSLNKYPFDVYDESGNLETTYTLQDHLEDFLEDGDKQVVEDAIKYHEWLLDAIEDGKLKLHDTKLRATKLILWAKTKNINIAEDILNKVSLSKNIKSITKSKQRENLILDKLNSLKVDPQNLPKDVPGKNGIKAQVRKILEDNPLFEGDTVFDKAWSIMTTNGKIKKQK